MCPLCPDRVFSAEMMLFLEGTLLPGKNTYRRYGPAHCEHTAFIRRYDVHDNVAGCTAVVTLSIEGCAERCDSSRTLLAMGLSTV